MDNASRSLAEQLERLADAWDRANGLIETRVAPALERIAAALERSALPPASDPRAEPIAAIRHALAEGRLDVAGTLSDDFSRTHPDLPESKALAEEVARARQSAIDGLRARIAASQSVNDPETVLNLHLLLAPLLEIAALEELNRGVVRWLLGLIMRRMRTGSVRGDVAALAEKIADRFGDTPEGASLRASLPTLRRSAGLCPRCGKPYTGLNDACPECLKAAMAVEVAVPAAADAGWSAEDPEIDPETGGDAAPEEG